MTTYEIVFTSVAEDGLSYVDLCHVDEVLETHLFEKESEPNNFKSIFNLPGDERETIREKYQESIQNAI